MNIKEFKERQNLKESKRTIEKWLDKGYILGAYFNKARSEWHIPSGALPPYTKARAKNQTSIRQSIVKGINLNRRVFAKLYKIEEVQFNFFINQLLAANIIVERKIGGFVYYNTTLRADEYLKSSNPDSILVEAGLPFFKVGLNKSF